MKLDHLKDSIIIQLGKNHGMSFEILNIYVNITVLIIHYIDVTG